MKCPKCAYPRAKFIDKKFEERNEQLERRTRTGAAYTTTVTVKKVTSKRGFCPRCKYNWDEGG